MAVQTHKEPAADVWYVDTGCSNHMCGSKSSFSYLNEDFHSTISFGDCSTVIVMGKGDVKIRTKNGFIETISNVFYVPDLKSNLLSAGQLQENGYIITIQQGACEIYDPTKGAIVIVEMSSNRLFPLKIESVQSCLMTEVKDSSWLWHFRYGHLSFGGLKTLQQKNMVTGLPQIAIPSQVCEECVVGKQHRSQFPEGKSWRAKSVLELVHSDICGPIKPSSNGGKRYLITFIDDYTRKTWVDFLQEKSEAFSAFKCFKARVENESGKTINTLRTDRGGEYCSKEFELFCEVHAIRRELTAAYTPQQNGVSERKNRTILNMVRSLLARGRIPKKFWPEAVNWIIHVLNRSPTFAVQDMTPEEAWSGQRPAVDHFRIFGCIAYAHIPDAKRKKLDDKSEKCVFLGVSEVSKAYKLFNPLTKKIVTSRDVVFEEESTWDWNRQQPTPVIFDSDAEEKMQPTPMISMPENTSNATPIVAETLPATGEATDVAVQSPRRARKRPAWMKDYKVTGIDQDDLIYTGNDSVMFEEFKKSMMVEFEMSDLGMMHYFLGIEVVQSTNGIFICQKKYVREILDRFQMKDCNPVSTPTEFGLMLNKDHEGEKVDSTLYKQIVGSLMYMENPTEKHMLAAKRIFRYLQGTRDFGLFYKKSKKLDFFGFTDSDYAGDQDDRRSTSGYVFMLGTGAVSWSSKKQSIVTLSTTEAEFVAATACACQAIWLRRILEELQFKQTGATIVFCDNNSAIKLSKNPVLHGRSKHIDVKYYFLRDLSIDGTIDLKYCRSEAQVADIFTKPLRFLPFQKLRSMRRKVGYLPSLWNHVASIVKVSNSLSKCSKYGRCHSQYFIHNIPTIFHPSQFLPTLTARLKAVPGKLTAIERMPCDMSSIGLASFRTSLGSEMLKNKRQANASV
ncbi:hypothetical protein RJ640_011064 [Escallonia rubra]|uniref:Integrase catalytic domain-containing protein n=1 Tax=Escallonia rubra TaxID=112253 RepID=A0AA88RCD9_9ASTE|nr:hypothetical protein RJ640_011064 [Escallonia rubra]